MSTPAKASAPDTPLRPVRRRHVLYLSGFDPSGPSRYHKQYREHARQQAALTGVQIEVGARHETAPHVAAWPVRLAPATADAAPPHDGVATHYEFLRWDDIVRDHWPRSRRAVAWQTVATTWFNLRHGALRRMLGLSWPPFLALFVPFLLVLAVVLLPVLAVLLGWQLGQAYPAALAWGAALGLLGLGLWGAHRAEQAFQMQWIMRGYDFVRRQASQGVDELEQRLDAFAEHLCQACQPRTDDTAVDEVLLVGHSAGTLMALSVLARALRRRPDLAARGPRLSLLTLGHWTPVLTSLPQAERFRDDIAVVARTPAVDWVDVSAPPDGCCFALVDPAAAAGIAPPAGADDKPHPKMLSARFVAMFSPARYAALKRDRLKLHFQYIMASELPGAYDYFAITAGPQSLWQRFAAERSVTDFRRFRFFMRRTAPPLPGPHRAA